MTLRHFLAQNNLSLTKEIESKIGEIISDRFRSDYSYSAKKTTIAEVESPVNDYPYSFLKDCEETIIQFLNPSHPAKNG